jgi:Flp pilus assembly protein CpaB
MKISVSGSGRRLAAASAVAVVCGVVVAGIFSANGQDEAVVVKTVPVLVSKSYVASQTMLDIACCYEKQIPEMYAPPRPLTKKTLGSTARFRARGEILKGEIITASRVSDAAASSASWEMGEGEMAVTLHFTPDGAMAGVIAPGDTVTVIASFAARACVLVPRARVMAVGRKGGRGDDAAMPSDETLVTLALSPKDAMRTVLGAQKAALALSLVSPLNQHASPACVALGDL